MNLGELIITLGADNTGLKAVKTEFKNFENSANSSINGLNKGLKDVSQSMVSLGKTLTASVTLPIVAAGAAAFKLQNDFESSLSKIVGLVGVSRDQVDAWGKDILELAPKLGKAPTELADALFFVTSAGIKGAEAMEVLEMSGKAAAAGLGETKSVADLVTSAMNAYGSANLSAGQATDILVAAVREGKAEAPALAQSLGQVLPIASEMGVTFDQVGAAVAAMTRTGTDAATASIQLRQILASMLKPSSEAADALDMMGTSAADMRDIIQNQGLFAALFKLKELQKEYGDETLSTVFPNIRALSGVLDLMGKNVGDTEKIFNSLSDATGALDFAFQTAAETGQFKWNQAVTAGKVALTELGASIQQAFLPILENITSALTRVTEWFRNLDESQRQTIIRVAAFAAALGPLLVILGTLGTVIASLSGPVVLIGIAVAGAATLIITHWDKIVNYFKNGPASETFSDIGRQFTELWEMIKDLFSAGARAVRTLWEKFGGDISSIINDNLKYIANIFRTTFQIILDVFKIFKGIFTLDWQLVWKSFLDILKNAANLGISFLELFINTALNVSKIVAKVFGASGDRITEFQGKISNLADNLKFDIPEAAKETQKALNSIGSVGNVSGGSSISNSVSNTTSNNISNTVTSSGIGETSKQLKELQRIMQETASQVSFTDEKFKILGDTFDINKEKTNIYTGAIEELIEAGFKSGDEAILGFKTRLTELGLEKEFQIELNEYLKTDQQEINDLVIQGTEGMEIYSESMEKATMSMARSQQAIGQLNSSINQFIAGALASLGTAIADAITGQQSFRQSILGIVASFGSFLQQMGKAIVAYGIAVQAFQAGFLNPAAAIIAGAGLVILGGVVKNLATKKAQKLAEGGIIPPGYPNDTYPALLTSGETVIPPGKLPNFGMNGQLVARVDGQDLLFILTEAENRNNLY